MESRTKSYLLGLAVGVAVGLGNGATLMNLYNASSDRVIPSPEEAEVQQGYVNPSDLEIELQDLDGDGKNETLMKYDGRSYLLKLDDKGKPQFLSYNIRPAEVVLGD